MQANDENDRSTEPEPNASADWRTEYDAQGVDAELRADGGRYALPSVGARVCDRDADNDELVVVEAREGTRADGYVLDSHDDLTVADVNAEFDPGAPVVEAVYVAELEETLDTWRSVEDVKDAVSFGAVGSYAFPADRLAAVDGGGSA